MGRMPAKNLTYRVPWLCVGPDSVARMVEKGKKSYELKWEAITKPEVLFFGDLYNLEEVSRNLGLPSRMTVPRCLSAAYERLGQRFIANLDGSYVLAVLDPGDRSVLCASDPLGQSRIYFALENGRLLIDFEVEPILNSLARPARSNEQAIYNFYHFGCGAIAPETFLDGIGVIPNGHFLRMYPQIREPDIRQYWSPVLLHQDSHDDDRLVNEYRELVKGAVAARIPERGTAIVAASGGLASSSVGFLMGKESMPPGATGLTLRLADDVEPVDQDSPAVFSNAGVDCREVRITQTQILEQLPQHLSSVAGPVDPAGFLQRLVFHHASDLGATRVISGFGTEAALCGSSGLKRAWVESLLMRGKVSEWTIAMKNLDHETRGSFWARTLQSLVVAFPDLPRRALAILGRAAIPDRGDSTLCSRGSWNRYQRSIAGYLDYNDIRDPLHRAIHTETMLARLPYCLEMNSYSARRAGISVAYPFLSQNLIRFSRSLPSALILDSLHDRIILRRAMAAIVPDEVRYPAKHTDSEAQIAKWCARGIETILGRARYAGGTFFASGKLAKIVDRIRRGKRYDPVRLWRIAALADFENRLRGHTAI